MELSSTLIGLLILSLFIIPVVLIARSGKNTGKRIEKDFLSEASKNELKISEKDFWNNYAIGIEKTSKKVIYLNWDGVERKTIVFKLNDVKTFVTIPGQSEITRKDYNFKKAERLVLRFTFRDTSKQDLEVVFFSSGFGKITEREIALFEKWSKIIREQMDFTRFDDLKKSA